MESESEWGVCFDEKPNWHTFFEAHSQTETERGRQRERERESEEARGHVKSRERPRKVSDSEVLNGVWAM